jgi:hypothetical protein
MQHDSRITDLTAVLAYLTTAQARTMHSLGTGSNRLCQMIVTIRKIRDTHEAILTSRRREGPRDSRLTEELRKGLESPIPAKLASELGLPSHSTFAEAIAARLIRLAAAGQIPAIREVYERTEGKPPKEVVSDELKNVQIGFLYGGKFEGEVSED